MPNGFHYCGLLLLALLSASAAPASKLYKWVDDHGNVIYSDQLPPQFIKREHARLSDQGVEVEHRAAAKSEEEFRQEREIARLRALQQELIAEQEAEDKVLLSNFRTEEDLLMARDGQINAIDSQVRLNKENILRSKARLEQMQARAADLERRGQQSTPKFLSQIDDTRESIEDLHLKISSLEQQKIEIGAQFDRDLNRFRQLRQLRDYNKPTETGSEPAPASILDSTVLCFENAECNRLWEMTKAYVRRHSTTRLQTMGRKVIVTAAPVKDDDLSLTASRIPETELGRERIFLDIQCRESSLGKEFCNSDEVAKVRTGFRAALRR